MVLALGAGLLECVCVARLPHSVMFYAFGVIGVERQVGV